MEVRGRNGKWLRAGNWGAVREVGLVVLFQFCAWIGKCGRGHDCVWSKYGSRSGRGSVDGKERADGRELVANFFLFNVEEMGNVFNHLFVGQGHLITSRAVRRRRSNDVGGIASTVSRG